MRPEDVPTPARLLELVDALSGKAVLLLVDLVVDRFVTGTPKRISREAPVLILRYRDERVVPGGGANAAANIQALDGLPLPVGVVGDDENGRALTAALARLGVTTDGILTRAGYRTPTKVRILGGGRHSIKQQIVRYDIEETRELSDEERQQVLQKLETWSPRAEVLITSDYGYGTVEPAILPRLRRLLGDRYTFLGDSRYRLGEFVGLDGATPNEEEVQAILGAPIGAEEELTSGGAKLLEDLGARFVVVTRGSQGMALFSQQGSAWVPVHGTDQVADVTGAGDTVIGTCALALAAGATPLEAALLANYAGGIVVLKEGTATLTRDELRAAIESDPRLLQSLRWAKS